MFFNELWVSFTQNINFAPLFHTILNVTLMKKLSFLILSFLFLGLISCGPSAKQKAAEQARLDSIAAAEELRIQDSIAEAEAIQAAQAAAAAAAAQQGSSSTQQATTPAQSEGTTRIRGTESRESDASDATRIRRATEESVKEVIDSTTTRTRRGG